MHTLRDAGQIFPDGTFNDDDTLLVSATTATWRRGRDAVLTRAWARS